jgi:hypothetical protein
MRSRYLWALPVALAFAGAAVGQEKDAKNTPGPRPNPYPVEVRFADDSTVKAVLLDKSIEVATRYGKLTVPVDEIRGIEFGLRIPEDAAKRIDAAVAGLASQDFKRRQDASAELLELRELAYPALQQAARSEDAEVSRRAKEALKSLAETVPAEKLHLPRQDTVVAADFTIVGKIETPVLKARTPYFGETSLKLDEVRAMRWPGSERETKLSVDAGQYGGQQEAWLDTGILVRVGAALQVTATGTVDLRPGDGGTSLVGPDGRPGRMVRGFPAAGPARGPARPAAGTQSPGALLGRIGESGKVFVVGSLFEGTATEEGKLYLRIAPSSTNIESSGSYEVRVITGR